MIFNYRAIDKSGVSQAGTVDAVSSDMAVVSLQRRGFVITEIRQANAETALEKFLAPILHSVPHKDLLVFTEQVSTLFGSQVSALKTFKLLASETEHKFLRMTLEDVADRIQGGSSISAALGKHPIVFSPFYVNMVRSGEESGKISEVFAYLNEYLNRMFEIVSKIKNALIYPAFVIVVFYAVLILMFTFVIPQLASIVEGSGQAIPIYTQVLFKVSDFMNAYWAWLLILSLTGAAGIWYWARSEEGIVYIDNLKLEIPVIGKLYRQLYPARIADNLSTLLSSGVSLVRSIEITASVVDHALYKEILMNVLEDVKGGKSLSKSIDGNKAFPSIFVQMVKVGEETGELGDVLKTVSKFYEREVYGSINTIVDLIVPMMIAFLGLAVGLLLVMVLMPIYNISSGSGF